MPDLPYLKQRYEEWSLLLASHSDLLTIMLFAGIAALLLGGLIVRRIKRHVQKNKRWAAGALLAPFVSPLLLIAVMMGGYGYALSIALPPFPYLFALKLAFAWLLIRFVFRIASKQEAGWIVVFLILPLVVLLILGVLSDFAAILDGFALEFGEHRISALMVLKGFVAIIILFWISGKFMRFANHKISEAKTIHVSHRTLISKLFQIILYFFVFIIALQIVGIDLTALSVFGGALGVGIGFGLQKIASNFISGIILLMERSIQVGDLVELNDGTVGFIKKTGARYTLMETFDYKEILIPNEEFIIERTTSWTHSNKIVRACATIGVAYDSDLDLVREIMLEEAKKHPSCSPNPEPFCVLEDFAESAINFTLYFYVRDAESGRLGPRSDVMMAVWRRFKQEGIEIPFPQRVVHYAKDS